jgi:hypothetical protein
MITITITITTTTKFNSQFSIPFPSHPIPHSSTPLLPIELRDESR